jgi:glutamate decarboxylase
MKEPSRAGEAARAFLARAAAASGSLPSLDSSIVVRWMESSFFAGSRPNEWQRSKTFSFGERRTTMGSYDNKDEIIAALQAKVDTLESLLQTHYNSFTSTYYASPHAAAITDGTDGSREAIPQRGMPARHVAEIIDQLHSCDFNPRLNTSSYVNVVSEPEERHVAALGATVNLADASVYPASVLIHDTVVNMIAELWHAPPPPAGSGGNYSGAGTVGSTEACLLAGLALKFRWRDWYARKVGKKPNSAEVLGVRPNLVISTCYQAAWEKFFRYFDVQPKFCKPKLLENSMSVDARELCALCDEETIGVVAILGNHYNGNYDPVWEINEELQKVNEAKGLQVGIHIDAASGGFIAPFQPEMASKSFDFRLQNVMSMSSSGHKFGESICGTGWVIFRHREDLAEHIAVTVTYLGGHCDSLTLNFSRPASGVYVQYYKLVSLAGSCLIVRLSLLPILFD